MRCHRSYGDSGSVADGAYPTEAGALVVSDEFVGPSASALVNQRCPPRIKELPARIKELPARIKELPAPASKEPTNAS